MVGRPGAKDAVLLARQHPGLSIGLHFDDRDSGDLDDPEQLGRAFAAQLERFRELVGADPTHVDSHHHSHAEHDLCHWSPPLSFGVPVARRLGERNRFSCPPRLISYPAKSCLARAGPVLDVGHQSGLYRSESVVRALRRCEPAGLSALRSRSGQGDGFRASPRNRSHRS
ncbi:ChbG/HpnK family deacetylase [Lacticaseibacillus rhamnosus]